MTKEKLHNDDFHLVRNNNGEWISEENAVFLSHIEVGILQVRAAQNGKTLSVQHGPDNSLWCYRHEYDEIINLPVKTEQTNLRTLKIKNRMEPTKENPEPLVYNGDKPFKRNARTHQSNFRANVLNVPFDLK